MTTGKCKQEKWLISALTAICLCVILVRLGHHYRLGPIAFIKQSARVIAVPISAVFRSDEIRRVEETTARYRVGAEHVSNVSPVETWQAVERQLSGFKLSSSSVLPTLEVGVPFVYQPASAEYLQKFRTQDRLDDIARGAPSEYDAMLRVGGWIGSQWDHGTDVLPQDRHVCDPVAVIEQGRNGAKYWCEIAARTLVHAASALAWQARLITGSRDGYTWQHAVAELWSNQFNKWFVIDADYNVVYREAGVPLSAFELHSRGRELQSSGRLNVQRIAPQKRSLADADMLRFYSYIHLDMRSDWCTRNLPRGSPVGGDRATWWTASKPLDSRLLTAKTRVDDPAKFDWHLNNVAIFAGHLDDSADAATVTVSLAAYSPLFVSFQTSRDDGAWQDLSGHSLVLVIEPGAHTLRVRARMDSGLFGPESRVDFSFQSVHGERPE